MINSESSGPANVNWIACNDCQTIYFSLSLVKESMSLHGMNPTNYSDGIMGAIASQITSITIVYSAIYSDADQRIHQSSASLAFDRTKASNAEKVSILWRYHRLSLHLQPQRHHEDIDILSAEVDWVF